MFAIYSRLYDVMAPCSNLRASPAVQRSVLASDSRLTVGLPVHGYSLRLLAGSCAKCVPTVDRRVTNPTIR